MLTPTPEQVRTLAPDASAARAGEGLADQRRWSGTGRTETAAWGLCQGSGSAPYQAAVDLGGPAYRCSCPSRKLPCKHALGLLFLVADGKVGSAEPPDWAALWLQERATRAAAAATRADRPAEVDPAARARRVEAREKKVADGIEELDRWLADLMRRGLDSAHSEGYRFWDAMGARLVDAQAAGLGRSVRALGSAASAGEAWPHQLLEGTARLHLLCEAYRRAEELPEPLRADVRSLVGWTTKEDELDPSDSVEDRWLVIGRRVDDSGQVMTARTFLVGEASSRFALHLAFGVDAAPPTVLAVPGQAFRATLTFFPSATPLRAVVRPMLVPDGEVTAIEASVRIDDVVQGYAERLALNPFLFGWPVALRDVVPVLRGERLLVRDADGTALPVVPTFAAPWLLAVSGGEPVTVVGEWDGSSIRPLSVLADGRLAAIEGTDGGPPARRRDGDATWDRLVSAALLGTERTGGTVPLAGPAAPLVDGRDAERAILAAAGVLAVRRRGGRRMASDTEPIPASAPADPRPALAWTSARLSAFVVAEERSLLPELLGLIRASGRRLPEETLPDLLAIAADGANADIRMTIAELAGPRLTWLAALLPDPVEGIAPPLGADWEVAWASASGTQRAALVRAMRRADPARAREALAGWLPDLPAEERAMVIEALEGGLGPDDEPLLVTALEDRRVEVRRAAAGLLARLPGSSFARAMESRARPLLASHGRLRPSLTVTLPATDPELEAAGFGGKAPAGLGERAWLLRQLLAHVPPARWTEWLGAEPPALIERALRAEDARPVVEGWIEATARFGDPTWAEALIAEPAVRATATIRVARVLAGVEPQDRANLVDSVAGRLDPQTLVAAVDACPPPWPGSLVDAVLGAIGKLTGEQYPEHHYYELVRAAAVGIPPARADDLITLASWDGQVRPALAAAVDTLRLRERLHDAFDQLPALPPTKEIR